jgi:stage V sporulation protein G
VAALDGQESGLRARLRARQTVGSIRRFRETQAVCKITSVRVKVIHDNRANPATRLHGFARITLDDSYVIDNLRILESGHGFFVAMPSRKLCDPCPSPTCSYKNHLRAAYCNHCGIALNPRRDSPRLSSSADLFADVVFPLNASTRRKLHAAVFAEFVAEFDRSMQPGYVCQYHGHCYDDARID